LLWRDIPLHFRHLFIAAVQLFAGLDIQLFAGLDISELAGTLLGYVPINSIALSF